MEAVSSEANQEGAKTVVDQASLFRESRFSMQGTIKRLIRDRGFGFIRSADGQEVFFHRSTLKNLNFDNLREGEQVEFEVEQGAKGPRATNVRASES